VFYFQHGLSVLYAFFEDWRNRDKWDDYETAVDEMLEKTNTSFAPWHILESNDKKYARIKALKIVIKAIEDKLEQNWLRLEYPSSRKIIKSDNNFFLP